jgi:hypothetical protein
MDQTAQGIRYAVQDFEARAAGFDADRIRQNAERFSSGRFRSELSQFVERAMERFSKDRHGGMDDSDFYGERKGNRVV